MGEGLFVEIDVVLDEKMQLREAHDIGCGALFFSSFFQGNLCRK
jgi:hypothetical protein